ncbi:MAG TPA: branched-chain amino acid ABC transporter substrate-binding protein [Solirubrobacteraceae bacterium]
MLSRWPGWVALAAGGLLSAAALAIVSCGGVSATEAVGNQLTIYSSLPLQGPSAQISQQLSGGEKLALSQAGGHVGRFQISYVSLDDANPTTGRQTPGESSAAAKQAAQDPTTIAYLGDLGSEATAVTLPLMNEAGILQVSPDAPYAGLTSSLDAGQDEPGRFYPSGVRNFARLQPGDGVEAAAQRSLMSSLGVHRLYVLDDQNQFQVPLATLVSADAAAAGLTVVGHDSLPTPEGANFESEVEKISAAKPDAIFVAGGGGPGTVQLWRSLHAADPGLLLLGSSSMANEAFTSQLGSAAAKTFLTTPILDLAAYPPAASSVLRAYRATFGETAGPWALYGYEAMSAVLDAIRRARSRGNFRPDVIRSFMATRARNSVIGRYSVLPDGETTFSDYGVDRVAGGRPVHYRTIHVTR